MAGLLSTSQPIGENFQIGADNAPGLLTAIVVDSSTIIGGLNAPFRETYYVDPLFVGTQTGSSSNPFTTIAAAFAAAVVAGFTNLVIFIPPASVINENVVFPSTGGNYVITSQSPWGLFAPAQINGTVTCNCSAQSRFALMNLQVSGAIAGDYSGAALNPRFLLQNVFTSSTVTLTASGGSFWRALFEGRASITNSEGGAVSGAVSVVGSIDSLTWTFLGPIAWTVSPTFARTAFGNPALVNTSGINTATFFTCVLPAAPVITAPAGSCVVALDGVTAVAANNSGLTIGANVTLKTLVSQRSVVQLIAGNVAGQNITSNPAVPGLYEVVATLDLVVAGTAGTAVLNVIYTDLNGVLQTKPVTLGLPITAAVGTEAAGSLLFRHNGTTPIQFSVTGIVTPGALSLAMAIAVMRRD